MDLVSGHYEIPMDYDGGPGKYKTKLYIKDKDQDGENESLVEVGTVSMWNTREQFHINIETKEEWKIDRARIYVGSDEIPTSNSGVPKHEKFPYKENFSTPISSYSLSLDLIDDLNITWGQRFKEERIQNIAVYVKLVSEEKRKKQGTYEEGWAYGKNEFESKWGWWTQYLIYHPSTGHFIDAPVSGLSYETSSHRGHTNSQGSFDYFAGETVTLSIGPLHLGTILAQHKISPIDLIGTDDLNDPRVINMARLLQSLDAKGDPTHGISITEPIISCLQQAMNELNIDTLNFADSDTVNILIERTVVYGSEIDGIDLKVVSAEEARDNLEKGTSSIIFRKNVSKTPEMKTAKAKIELMPVYVPACKANGDPVKLEYMGPDGTVLSTRDVAKPLVVVYADEIPDTGGAMDVFSAISRDEGNTWKRKNLSRSADRSSFTLGNGFEYPGDVRKPQCKVKGNKILVSWTSKYARNGQPKYALTDENSYYEDDIWGVGGPQRSFDYTELDFPEVGEIPFSCVWICRGIINSETGNITWFKAERLTSGRRDAYQLMFNGAINAGFAITWQEDSKGLRPGEHAGPGEGWSGATTNHKTDIWYSYIKWDEFDKVDTTFVSSGDSQHDETEDMVGRPKALVSASLPVRISDNDTLNADNLMATKDTNGNWIPKRDDAEKPLGSHRYGYMIEGLCDRFYEKTNNKGETKQVCVTTDGRLLEGDTGASRPNIMLQPYQKPDGSYSAWAILCYEETKGVGSGPPETNTESVSNENSGEGQDSYFPDLGKNVIYHSFDFANPDLVSAGTILNPQAKDAEGNLLYLMDENDNYLKDWNEENIPAYENARRPRFIIQSKKKALGNEEEGTVLVCLFKMGEEGKGRPSDIFMRRWVVNVDDKGNPYDSKYLTSDIQNISSVTPTETWENPDSQSGNRESIKVLRWEQTEENLADFSWTNPYEDARAHRGFIRGKFLAIAYDWTPNWAATRNGNDVYNLYIRRSFDGGANWTTDPEGSGVTHCDIFKTQETNENHEREEVWTSYGPGEFEPARNVSQLRNTKESVIEPRLVGVPGTILTDGTPLYPEDKENTEVFWVTYGTESNPGKSNEEEVGCPLDIYYSYSTDRGEIYYTISKTINPEGSSNYAGDTVEVWDWLAKDSGHKVAEQAECQIRMTPDGSILYAVWNETGEEGSDVIFRRIMIEEGSIESLTRVLDPVNSATRGILLTGIADRLSIKINTENGFKDNI